MASIWKWGCQSGDCIESRSSWESFSAQLLNYFPLWLEPKSSSNRGLITVQHPASGPCPQAPTFRPDANHSPACHSSMSPMSPKVPLPQIKIPYAYMPSSPELHHTNIIMIRSFEARHKTFSILLLLSLFTANILVSAMLSLAIWLFYFGE